MSTSQQVGGLWPHVAMQRYATVTPRHLCNRLTNSLLTVHNIFLTLLTVLRPVIVTLVFVTAEDWQSCAVLTFLRSPCLSVCQRQQVPCGVEGRRQARLLWVGLGERGSSAITLLTRPGLACPGPALVVCYTPFSSRAFLRSQLASFAVKTTGPCSPDSFKRHAKHLPSSRAGTRHKLDFVRVLVEDNLSTFGFIR